MDNTLQKLGKEDLQNLMERYYAGENVSRLIKEYHLSVSPSKLYTLFPPEVFNEYHCEYCDEPLVMNRKSKTWQNGWKNKSDLYCPLCGHRPFVSHCNCRNCQEKELRIINEKREQIKEAYSRSVEAVDFEVLSFVDKVFLGTLCRALLKEDLHEIAPLNGSQVVLTPTENLNRKLYLSLIHQRCIVVNPYSPLHAFVDDESFPRNFDLTQVSYYLNLKFPANKTALITDILKPKYYTPEKVDEALALWKEIAVAECIEYLLYQFNKVRLPFENPGEKTYKMFELLLEDFSVSQIYCIIYKQIAEATRLYMEKGITKRHAANSVIGGCMRFAERAKINGWNLFSYNRIRELPSSELSQFYFYQVLKIGERGFREPPVNI